MTGIVRDPLLEVEALTIAAEATSGERHDVKNHLGVITNAVYYLKKRVEPTEVFLADARMGRFFGLIDEALTTLAARVGGVDGEHALQRASELVDVRAAVELAVASHRALAGDARVVVSVEPASIVGDRREIALAIRALLENALEASGGAGEVHVTSRASEEAVSIDVSDRARAPAPIDHEAFRRRFFTTKPGRLGLGVNLAARIAARHRGSVAHAPRDPGTVATVTFARGVA